MLIALRPNRSGGFSLIEVMMALMILTFGLLSIGQLLFVAASSGSLSRSKETAVITAQSKMEYLSGVYSLNPSATELTPGNHGPQQAEVPNPVDGTTLNKFNITWVVQGVSDPRPGRTVSAKRVTVTITPIEPGGAENVRVPFGKAINLTTVLSPRVP
jgi:prepilin-type N-terminal cleavage/methylation domain-containing protein